MQKTVKWIAIVALLVATSSVSIAQKTLNIGICKDAETPVINKLSASLQVEINNLISSKYTVSFTEISANMDAELSQKNIEQFMNDAEIDYVIAVGYISSKQISKLDSYSKPVIAGTILDGEMQKIPLKEDKTSGVNNFAYIESVIRIKENLIEFSKIFETENLVVIIPQNLKSNFPLFEDYLGLSNSNINLSIISVTDSVNQALTQISENTDGVVVMPMIGYSQNEVMTLFSGLNEKHIPSLALSGVDYLNLGATITMTPEFTMQQLARQIALRVMKISEGMNPSEISVELNDDNRVSIINMESIRSTNKFPEWNILNESILLNVSTFSSGKNMNLRMAISESLENNLQSKMAGKEVEIADKEVRIAKANILPQISVGGSAIGLSDNLVETAMGQRGSFTLNGTASLKQVLFSESVFANIAINQLMAENMQYYNEQVILDVISKTSMSYISLLFSKSNLLIQNENVITTMKNLEMAKSKESAGQTGYTDVNRWISEMNLNKIQFNDAYTVHRSNMYELNKQLNSEINSTINIEDSSSIDETIFVDTIILKRVFENPMLTEKYASFIIEEMKINSPELQQLEKMAEVIERKSKLYKHQGYMPELALFDSLDQALIREGAIQPEGLPIPPPPDDMTYNVGVSLSIPVFQGGRASAEAKKSRIELDKLNYQKEDLLNILEAGIRTNVQKLRTSYLELELSKNAAEAAESNFIMVQKAYNQGAVSITDLIDAQNVMNRTKLMANISYYQYILDYLIVERYQGKYNFLSTDEEREDYINRLQNFLVEK
jgi:outer membrane protein TolC